MNNSFLFLLSIFLFLGILGQKNKPLNTFEIPCSGVKSLPFANEKSTFKELDPLVIDGVEVHRKAYELADEQIVFLKPCEGDKVQPVLEDKYEGRLAGVARGFISYETQGRAFAYRFTHFFVTTKNGFITARAGAAGDIYYIDEFGEGTFQRKRGKTPLEPLPDWVKKP